MLLEETNRISLRPSEVDSLLRTAPGRQDQG